MSSVVFISHFSLVPSGIPSLFTHLYSSRLLRFLTSGQLWPGSGHNGNKKGGEHPSYDENIYISIMMIMVIIQSAGYPVMYIQMLQAQLWLLDTRRAITPFA